MMITWLRHSVFWPAVNSPTAWVFAATIVVIAGLAMPLLADLAGESLPPYITFYPAVVIAALVGGPIVGVVTGILTLLIAWWFFVPDYGSFVISGSSTPLILIIYCLTSTFLGWTVGQARLALDAAVASEAKRTYAARESVHRIKNLLAVVQAISLKVFREVTSKEQYRDVLSDRLAALSIAQDVLVQHDWQDASLNTVIDSALAPFLPNPGLSLSRGPDAIVPADHVSGLCMALYELATNAMKYGALAEGRGPVALRWNVKDGNVVLEWDEKTPTDPNHVESFGAKLIHSALSNDPTTSVCYRLCSEGVYARFEWKYDNLSPLDDTSGHAAPTLSASLGVQ